MPKQKKKPDVRFMYHDLKRGGSPKQKIVLKEGGSPKKKARVKNGGKPIKRKK